MLASFYKNIERLTYFLKKWALYIHLFCTPLYLIRHLRLLAALATCCRCARKMLLWIYGQWFSFSIYFFLNRVKDVNVNLVQCEITNHLVTFSRPQIPCACVVLFHFFFFVCFFFCFSFGCSFYWNLPQNCQRVYPFSWFRSEAFVRRCSVKRPKACKFIKKESLPQVFSCEFAKFLGTPFLTEHL